MGIHGVRGWGLGGAIEGVQSLGESDLDADRIWRFLRRG